MQSQTKINNRKKLTQYWVSKGVNLDPLETIDDYIIVPGDETDWIFYPLIKWLKEKTCLNHKIL